MTRRSGALLVFLVGLALYLPALRYGFTYDDVPIIVQQPLIHSLGNWREILTTPWWANGMYRPLARLTLALDWSLAGGAPWLFHLTNAILHAAAGVLVFLLAAGMLPLTAAVAAGLLFAVHPVHVEAVANVVGRAEVLATLFTLLAALAYRRDGELAAAGETSSRARRLASFGTLTAVLFALASKESAFAAPGILFLVDWMDALRRGERLRDALGRHWALWAGTVALAGAWLWLRSLIVRDLTGSYAAPGLDGLDLFGRGLVMLPVVLEYLRLLFLPARLSADYSPDFIPIAHSLTPAVLLGAAALAGCAGAALAFRRRAPAVTFALGWMGATLLVVSNLVVPTGVLLAERTLYLASVGACLLLAFLWSRMALRAVPVAAGLLALVLAAGAARSVSRAEVWTSNETLFPQLVRDAPGSFRGDWIAAMLAYESGDRKGGERLLRRGLATYAGVGNMWNDYANQLQRDGRWREAADNFWTAFRVDSGLVGSAARAVAAGIEAGEIDTAEARLRVAGERHPGSDQLTIAASHVALARGHAMQAMTLRRQVALRSPEQPEYWYLTADAARRAKSCPELVHSLERVRALGWEFPAVAALRDSSVAMGCAAAAVASGQ